MTKTEGDEAHNTKKFASSEEPQNLHPGVIFQLLWPLQVFDSEVKSSITDTPYTKNCEMLRFYHNCVGYGPKWI